MNHNSVMIKSNKYGLNVVLDDKIPFPELLLNVAEKFKEASNFFKNAKMAISFSGRELSSKEEKELVSTIVSNSHIHILCVIDGKKESEERYHHAVEASMEELKKQDGQFYRGTLKPGQVLETETSIVIIGDVNPGASVISKGNIVVIGSCRGNVYAGASGNAECFVAALVMRPIQVRIADKTARSPIVKWNDNSQYRMDPKIAYIKEERIHIKTISQDILSDLSQEEEG